MATTSEYLFYNALPVQNIPIYELLTEPTLMKDIPSSWHVIITDIRKSTQAVKDGKHEQVNLIATGSIVTVLNISIKEGINVPFFFGGDGATFLVPDCMIEVAMESLIGYRQQMMDRFGLYIRTASMSVNEIYTYGHRIKIAKCCNSENFVIPVIIGMGLNYAEKEIKSRLDENEHPIHKPRQPNLNGMQCRWTGLDLRLKMRKLLHCLSFAAISNYRQLHMQQCFLKWKMCMELSIKGSLSRKWH
jgi:hypothetical protein